MNKYTERAEVYYKQVSLDTVFGVITEPNSKVKWDLIAPPGFDKA